MKLEERLTDEERMKLLRAGTKYGNGVDETDDE